MTALSQLFHDESSVTSPAAIEQAIEQHLGQRLDLASWEAFEQSPAGQDHPEWVAKTYISILRECEQSGSVPESLLMHAFDYCNEWFSSDPEEQACALIELAELAPHNQAIFDQCTVTLTHAQRWESLLAIHDRRVEAVAPCERRQVLEQAAQIAQDFEQDAGRALGYYASILEIDPANDRIFTIFVRLVTREKAWSLYAETLAKRAAHLSPQDAQAALLGRSALLIEELSDYPTALIQYAEILDKDPSCDAALQALIQVSQDLELPLEIQCSALEKLHTFHRNQDELGASLKVLEQHIERIAPARDAALEHSRLGLLQALEQGQALSDRSAEFFLFAAHQEEAQTVLRERMTQEPQRFSVSLLQAFANYEGQVDFSIASALLASAKELAGDKAQSTSVACTLSRILVDSSIDLGARQHAAQLFCELDQGLRYEHEDPQSLEIQIELAAQEPQRVSLLIRLANRLEDQDEQEANFCAWQRVLELRPEHVPAQDKIATELSAREDWDSLAEHLEHSVTHCADKERELGLQLKLVDLDLEHRDRIEAGIARMRVMLEHFPDAEQVATLYHETLLKHERHQEFVDWLLPRSFSRRDVPAMVECGEVYLHELSDHENCAKCVLEALTVRPEFSRARDLGLELLRCEPDLDKAALANAVWRSFATVEVNPDQLDDFGVAARAYAEKETQASLWLEAEARFERGPSQSEARLHCLCQALACDPEDARLPSAFVRLIQDDPEHAPTAFEVVSQTVRDQSLAAERSALLYDLAATLAEQATDPGVDSSKIVATQLQAWRTEPNARRHLRALFGAISAQDWDAIVELTVSPQASGSAFEPGELWSKVCQETHPAPESIPLALVQKFAAYFAQNPDRFDRSRIEWTWQVAKLLAHHQDFEQARELALPLAYQQDLSFDPSRLRTLGAWLRMEPIRKKEALNLLDSLQDHLHLNVEERRAHAALERELRSPGSLALQLAAFESCERALLTQGEDLPAPVLSALQESLAAYIEIAVQSQAAEQAVQIAQRALGLPLEESVYQEIFELCWSGLDYPKQFHAQIGVDPKCDPMIELLAMDRQRLLEFGVGYASDTHLWRGELLGELLGAKHRYFECMQVLVERLERAEAQGPPNTPQQLMRLRLAISSTLRELSRDDGQLNYLLTNLEVVAAHPESLHRAATLLHERGDHERLAQLWSDQATALVEHHDGDRKLANTRAADLWCQAANCYEIQLESPKRAVAALEEARKLVSRASVLDKLVKFYLSEDCLDKSRAAAHLHRRLDLSSKEERLPLSFRLAKLYLEIKQARQSQSVIDEVFERAAPVVEFRRLYLQAIDAMQEPPKMLEARVKLTPYFSDEELANATETSTRLLSQLDAHEIDIRELLPLLEQSAPKKPGDLALQKHYVTALSATGRRDDAAAHLSQLIEAHGRRRSAERAALHAMLGDQYALSRNLKDAAVQFEQAALMDDAQSQRWIDVARLYESLEDIPAAERALRTLMVHAQKRDLSDVRTPTAAWVMLKMYLLNQKAGREEIAQRHWESCRDRCASEIQAAREVLCELAKDENLHERYLELADRLLGQELSSDFKAEILAQRAEHLEQSGDSDSAFEMILAAISHDPTPASYSAKALALANSPERTNTLDEHLDRILSRGDQGEEQGATQRAQKVMALCTKARLCAASRDRHGDIEGYLEQAQALDSRPIELLRTRHDVAYQIGNMELLRSSLEHMHQQGVLAEPSLGDSWLARAEQYATRSHNFRLALRAIDEALSCGVSRRRALDVLLAFPRFDNPDARGSVLDTMQAIAQELCDEDAVLTVLEERIETKLIDDDQLAQLHRLASQKEKDELALAAIEATLARFDESENPSQIWAVWAFVDQALEQEECSEADKTRIWRWLAACGRSCEESAMQGRVSRVIARKWYPESPQACIQTIEALVEHNPTFEPYRSALWDLYHAQDNASALFEITQRNLALLEEAPDRAQMRIRFVEATWKHEALADKRMEMLKATLTEDPGHPRAQALLIEHYRDKGELQELEDLLKQRLQSALEQKDTQAQIQLGLSLAKISYDRDPVQALVHCRELFDQSELPQVEMSEVCIEWLRQDSGRSLFAQAFAQAEVGSPECWGPYQAFLLERYKVLIAHGDKEQRKNATLQASAMLGEATRVDESIALLLAYRQVDPQCRETEWALFEAYERDDRYQDLVELLLRQAQQDPANSVSLTRKAAQLTKEQLEDPERALQMLDALNTEPGSEEHYELLAEQISYLDEEDATGMLARLEAGIPDLEALEQVDPDSGSAHDLKEALGHLELQAKKAELLAQLGKHAAALVIYRRLAAVDGPSYRAQWLRCQSAHLDALIEGEDQAAAHQAWSASVHNYLFGEDEEKEDGAERLCMLGRRLATQGLRDASFLRDLSKLATYEDDQALELCCQEWTIECDDTSIALAALESLVQDCIEASEYDKARDYLDQCASTLGQQAQYLTQLKKIYELQEDYPELAKLEYGAAGDQEDDALASEAFKQAATWFEKAGDLEGTRTSLEQAALRAPQDHELLVRLVDLDLQREDTQSASERLDQALSAVPKDKDNAPLIAQLSYKKSQLMGACEDQAAQLEWLQKAHNMNRNDVEIASDLADLAEQQENWDLASRALRQLSSIGEDKGAPANHVLCLRQARLWQSAQDLRKASFWAHKARHADPGSEETRALLEELAAQQKEGESEN